jgi:DEAD/DEAH box helicase domain-containing protein
VTSADALVRHLRETLAARAGEPSDVLVHERALPAQLAEQAVLRPRLPPLLARALVGQGIGQLYAHQVETIEHLRAGRNVVLASPTASGKSLAFAVPTLERLLGGPDGHALYLYPTKALIADQLRALRALTASLPVPVGVLTGDTPRETRAQLAARPPGILLANPDILHHSLLPDHRRWGRLLAGLQTVVLDEVHAYRGVFGAHVALVLRRLRRLARAYGADPTFIAASATIANPVELAEQVVGLPFVAVKGDRAGAGPRRFLFWRPPLLGDPTTNEHESVFVEAASIFAEALRAGYRGILFGRARVTVERMLLDVRRQVGPELAAQVSAYKSGYRSDERAQIEAGLRSGALRGVVSTNALELGIDIGALDVVVLAGYPGSAMSFWQQAGRVGRRADREAVVVLVAGDDALDQYHVQHPDTIFGQTLEHAAVDPGNPSIELGHLLCAAAEAPLQPAELELWPANAPRLVERLTAAGELQVGPPWRAAAPRVHADVALRGTSREPYTLQAGDARPLGSIEPPYVQRECYPGALYLHNGRGYRVTSLDAATRVVRLAEEPPDARTSPLLEVRVAPRETAFESRPLKLAEVPIQATVGPLRVVETVVGYRESRRGHGSFTQQLETPLTSQLDTIGLWLDIPPALEPDADALHAFEHGLVNALPLALLCDRRDLGSSSDTPEGGRVYLYDFAEGGTGLTQKAFELLDELLRAAATLLRDCQCAAGCPSCMHVPGCPRANNQLDKIGGLALLEGRAVGGAHAAHRLLRPAPRPPTPPTAPGRQRRLRAIADADLRERYGAAPDWMEPGDLAQLPDGGIVLVRAIGRGTAEVQSLSGGEPYWVRLGELSPPRASS